jgi:hypothetical protein
MVAPPVFLMPIIHDDEFQAWETIALGSLRESQTWYQAVSRELAPEMANRRSEQFTELRKLLIGAQKWLVSKPQRTQLM